MQVVVPSTPAQMFHLLRRQVLRPLRKPLIVMTPKYLLRREESSLDDLASGRFQRIVLDAAPRRQVNRVLLCSGKVYYDLVDQRQAMGRDDIAILRVEMLAPLPVQELRAALAPYPDGTPVAWVQEEPENMGAWRYLRVLLGERLFDRLPFTGVTRKAAASPATGSGTWHKKEQKELLARAFGGQ
jgi:2-oxoglutarate dehydrogenase E1 component